MNREKAARDAGAGIGQLGEDASERVSDWTLDTRRRVADAGRRVSDTATQARSKAAETAEDAKSTIEETTASLGEGASSLYDAAKSHASEAYGQAADAASRATSTMADTASDLRKRTTGATRDFLQFCREQPLILAGVGLALGAIVGGLIPSTETEDQLMGDTSDQMKEKARSAAEDQAEQAKTVVKGAFEQTGTMGQSEAHNEAHDAEAPLLAATD